VRRTAATTAHTAPNDRWPPVWLEDWLSEKGDQSLGQALGCLQNWSDRKSGSPELGLDWNSGRIRQVKDQQHETYIGPARLTLFPDEFPRIYLPAPASLLPIDDEGESAKEGIDPFTINRLIPLFEIDSTVRMKVEIKDRRESQASTDSSATPQTAATSRDSLRIIPAGTTSATLKVLAPWAESVDLYDIEVYAAIRAEDYPLRDGVGHRVLLARFESVSLVGTQGWLELKGPVKSPRGVSGSDNLVRAVTDGPLILWISARKSSTSGERVFPEHSFPLTIEVAHPQELLGPDFFTIQHQGDSLICSWSDDPRGIGL
jgi:hypothetical protein